MDCSYFRSLAAAWRCPNAFRCERYGRLLASSDSPHESETRLCWPFRHRAWWLRVTLGLIAMLNPLTTNRSTEVLSLSKTCARGRETVEAPEALQHDEPGHVIESRPAYGRCRVVTRTIRHRIPRTDTIPRYQHRNPHSASLVGPHTGVQFHYPSNLDLLYVFCHVQDGRRCLSATPAARGGIKINSSSTHHPTPDCSALVVSPSRSSNGHSRVAYPRPWLKTLSMYTICSYMRNHESN